MSVQGRQFLGLVAATFVAIVLSVVGALILKLPGGVIGGFLGGLLIGRRRRRSVFVIAASWAAFVLVGGLTALGVWSQLREFASFGATALLFMPGGFLGGAAAGATESLLSAQATRRNAIRTCLAFSVGTIVGATCFRLGFPALGALFAAATYAAVISYGARMAE